MSATMLFVSVRHMSLKQLYVDTIILSENHNIIGLHSHCIKFNKLSIISIRQVMIIKVVPERFVHRI